LLTPPTTTLFPYTTLFRSSQTVLYLPDGRQHGAVVPFLNGRNVISHGLLPKSAIRIKGINRIPAAEPIQAWVRIMPQWITRNEIDRKSTRLNSSHVSISYA